MKYFLLFLLILITNSSIAADPEVYSHRSKGAIKGYDPVAFFNLPAGAKAIKGSDKHTYKWKGATWKFSSEENKQKFIQEPDLYSPQYGGYCAFAVAHGFTTSPRPDNWRIVDGKLYLNNNKKSYEKWLNDYQNKIAKADKNWPDVLED